MRLNRLIFQLLALVIIPMSSFAQGDSGSALVFERNVWDFGVINEVDGPVSYTFKFNNNGDIPLVLERVMVSCGCTTPEYTREPIMPGEEGQIKITFDPADRPGTFIKDIYISSGGGKNRDKITVRGEVKGRPRSIEEDYPYQLSDGLRLTKFDTNFGYIDHSKPFSMVVGYANTSDKPVKFDFSVSPVSENVSVSALPTICAGCKGDITITYDMRGSASYGRVAHKVELWVNGRKETLGITTTAIVVDRFAPYDSTARPEMKLMPSIMDVGDVSNGTEVEAEFAIANEGERLLIVRAVQPRKNVTTDLKPGTQIAPGDELTVKASLKPSGIRGGFFADGIYITTNDPVSPMKELRIMGKIK